MVGQPRRHRRRPLPHPPMLVPFTQRPNSPTEIIAVNCEIGHRFMHLPILRERVRLPHLPGVAMPVRRVVPLQERHVHLPADLRAPQRPSQRRHRPEDQMRPGSPPPDPTAAASPPWRRSAPEAAPSRAPSACCRRPVGVVVTSVAVDVQDRLLVGRVVVAGQEPQRTALGPLVGRQPPRPRHPRRCGPRGRRRAPACAPRHRPCDPTNRRAGHRPGWSGSQCSCFLNTNDHFSSNWTSRV